MFKMLTIAFLWTVFEAVFGFVNIIRDDFIISDLCFYYFILELGLQCFLTPVTEKKLISSHQEHQWKHK